MRAACGPCGTRPRTRRSRPDSAGARGARPARGSAPVARPGYHQCGSTAPAATRRARRTNAAPRARCAETETPGGRRRSSSCNASPSSGLRSAKQSDLPEGIALACPQDQRGIGHGHRALGHAQAGCEEPLGKNSRTRAALAIEPGVRSRYRITMGLLLASEASMSPRQAIMRTTSARDSGSRPPHSSR